MCGIWASVAFDVGRERIMRVAHRGPDGEGWRKFTSPAGPVALGHRRLSIIDTSDAGHQPMGEPSGRYWLTFNGEIYNYRELRHQLVTLGFSFRSTSDSEVLLAALMAWGEAALPRLDGMFAFAFYDDMARTILVARDRFGIKPLYWARDHGAIAFASEIKQLYDLPGVSRAMNLARVRDFLATGICDHTGETMLRGVEQLRGGEVARIDLATWTARTPFERRRWYHLPEPGSIALPLAAAATRYRETFEVAIDQHLRSDVPLGSCLSGGLDSSSIVGVASRQLGAGHPMTTVSAVFDQPRVDERRFMEAVIAATGARARFTTVDPRNVFETAREVIWHQDEPYGSTSIHAQWAVFGEARASGVRVMLDGQGADEPLAGYHSMYGSALADLIGSGRWIEAARTMTQRHTVQGQPVLRQITGALPTLMPPGWRADAYKMKRAAGGADWLDGEALAPFRNNPDPVAAAAKDQGWTGRLDMGTLCSIQTMATSLPMLLHWEDRSSMAHGIEARVPFLDHHLVELAIGLGRQHKIEGVRTKVLLREALGRDLPQMVRERTDKLGFATPEQEWFCGPLAPAVRAAIQHTLDLYPTLLNAQAVLRLTDDVLSRRRAFDFTLWRIAMIGIWGERFDMTV
jgi:asparagine synthase (glutamine-hydrolysing)